MKLFLSYKVLISVAILLAIMPPGNPHLVEKSSWLMAGTLTRPLDIFDLLWHAWPLVLLGIKVGRELGRRFVPPAQA
jgi:hypothetical protein